jgi:nucleoside-diphosphate-sugar epimerase
LLQAGYNVAVLQRSAETGRRLLPLRERLTFIRCLDGTVSGFSEQLSAWAPEIVLHLGWAGVANLERNNVSLQIANIQFSAELAELCVQSGVSHFIGAGSQAEYGPKHHLITETEYPAPTTLYGAAKLSAGMLTQRICELSNVKHSWLRIFSTYGPDDNPGWLLPSLVRQLRAGQRPKLTPCEQTWDYLHVEDAAAAFLAVADTDATGIFNLASGRETRLRSIIEQVRDLVAPEVELGFGEIPYRADQVMRMAVSVQSLMSATGWEPKIDLQTGLRQLEAEAARLANSEQSGHHVTG